MIDAKMPSSRRSPHTTYPPQRNNPAAADTWQPALLYLSSFACMVLVSYLTYKLVSPAWTAPGYPSFSGYGKNVEQAAIALTILCCVTLGAFYRRLCLPLCVGLVAMALPPLVRHYAWAAIPPLIALVAGFCGFFTWFHLARGSSPPEPARARGPSLWLLALLVPLAMAWFFFAGLRPMDAVDLHHDGEVITGALDLLAGGVPYRTFYMPHGLSDSGVAALLIAATGNKGLGTIALLVALETALGFVSIFLLGWGLLRSPWVAFACSFVIATLLGQRIGFMEGALFPMLAFWWISRRQDRAAKIGCGALLGIGYVWRIDMAVYSLVSVAALLALARYDQRASTPEGRARFNLANLRTLGMLAGDLLLVLVGVSAALIALRLPLGFPTREWFQETLVNIPRYHADSTGFPLPVAWRVPGPAVPLSALQQIGLPIAILMFLGGFAFLAAGIVQRRLSLQTPRDRYLLLALVFGLLGLKTVIDRSDDNHIVEGCFLLTLTLIFECLYAILAAGAKRRRLAAASACCLFAIACTAIVRVTAFLPRGYGVPGVNGYYFILPQREVFDVLKTCLSPTVETRQYLQPTYDPEAPEIAAGVDQVRSLLEEHKVGARQLLVYHSAALLYPMLGRKLPTKFYELGWAADPAMEHDLIAELKRNHVRAFLHAHGYGALDPYDVPDSWRIPYTHLYIESQEALGERYATPIGELTIVDSRPNARRPYERPPKPPGSQANEDTQ